MVQMVEQHAAFFLVLFAAVWTLLLALSTILVRATQKRMTEFEIGQLRQDVAIGELKTEVAQNRIKVQDMSESLNRVEARGETLLSKFGEMSVENAEAHATIIEGRTSLIERVAALEAKANGKMDALERSIHALSVILGDMSRK